MTDGVLREFSDRVEAELVHEITTERVDGLVAEVELEGDLFNGQALGEELQRLAFA